MNFVNSILDMVLWDTCMGKNVMNWEGRVMVTRVKLIYN
jgi:hypothetical protein